MMKNISFFWKISAIFLAIFGCVGLFYVFVSVRTAENYFKETSQRLYGDLAEHLVKEGKPFLNGKPDTASTHHIMHSMMMINPSVEVYLLDTTGKIVDYVVPYNKVKLDKVALAPIFNFIEGKGKKFVLGDDPKSSGEQNIFSAAPVTENGQKVGYAYLILAGEKQKEVSTTLLNSYYLRTGAVLFLVAILISILAGLIAIGLITKNLSKIIEAVQRFKEGDRKVRLDASGSSELTVLATTFNAMADTIDSNIEELKSIENLRRELIANVSHDLRTPLAILQGYIETLLIKKDLASDLRERYLKIVLDSSEKLSKLIAQLFEYSKLEAKEVQPQKEPFFLADLAQDIFQKYQLSAEQKQIKLTLDQPQKLPLVFADISLVERVIQNLLDNALKFTPAGGEVLIELKLHDGQVEVRIADNGPGIPEAEQSAIFDRYRKSTSEPSQTAGAGLGLAIVKKILELHDATIRVQSRLNEGSAFMFELPAYRVG
jgi:signal transduction histidine kinase